MRDKMIRDRRKSGQRVSASAEIHVESVADALETNLAGELQEGEILPDFRTMIRLLGRRLSGALGVLLQLAGRHLAEIDNDVELRNRRDTLLARLGTKISRFRSALVGIFGPDSGLTLAGLDGRTAQEPVALLAQAERIFERFEELGGEAGTPTFRGFQMDPQEAVEELRSDYDELRAVVDELQREDRRSDATLIAKNEAMADYDQVFRWVASCLEALFHLSGQHELAQRVRPSVRRPGRTQAEVEAEEGSPSPSEEPADGDRSAEGGGQAASPS